MNSFVKKACLRYCSVEPKTKTKATFVFAFVTARRLRTLRAQLYCARDVPKLRALMSCVCHALFVVTLLSLFFARVSQMSHVTCVLITLLCFPVVNLSQRLRFVMCARNRHTAASRQPTHTPTRSPQGVPHLGVPKTSYETPAPAS